SASQAEAAVLGCRIDELTVALFKYWKVPTVIIESFLTDQIPTAEELQSIARLTHTPDQLPGFAEDKRITILMNGPLILAYCATRVAQEANIVGWGSKNLPFFYRVVAAILHIRLGDAVQLTHFATTEAAREVKHLGKPSLAAHLLSPILFTRSSAQAETVKRVAANPLNQLQSKLKGITDSKQRATLAMKAMLSLFKGSSSAVLILHHNKIDEKLRPILQFGFDTDILRRVRWNSPSSVISKLNTKRVAVHFDNAKLNAMSKDMPEGTDKLFEGTQDLFLASSPIDEANTYIYWLFGQTQLNREQFDTFKKIIKLADQ
ncbi:MAG: metal-dependent hydrolase, partial [Pseudomonadota bacterium]|nr:metal-dependent hydrolase [Pseudomonadota bacterium]